MVTPTNNGWIPNTSPPFVNIANWGFNVFNIMFWQYVMVQLKGSVAISFGVLRNREHMGNWCPLEGWGPIPTRSSAQPLLPHWREKSMYPSHASTSSSTMSRLVLSSSVCSVYVKMASQLNHHLPLWC